MPFFDIQTRGKPLTIKDEGVTLNSNVSSIDFTGNPITGSVIGSDVTEAVSGGLGSKETPVGAINGSNKVFTVSNTPNSIFVNGMLQEEGATRDYTVSGLTITFVTAPPTGSRIISAY